MGRDFALVFVLWGIGTAASVVFAVWLVGYAGAVATLIAMVGSFASLVAACNFVESRWP